MPVPGKHDEEPRTEVQGDVYAQWLDARAQAVAWGQRAADLRAKLEDQMGTSTGGLVNGKLVVTYRYKQGYATQALMRDHPALTQHYMRTREVSELDIDQFALVHRDIADKYRIRQFRTVDGEDKTDGGE
jgi:hypothetical protein